MGEMGGEERACVSTRGRACTYLQVEESHVGRTECVGRRRHLGETRNTASRRGVAAATLPRAQQGSRGLMEARVVGVALFLIVRRARRLCPLLMERVVFVCFSVLCVSVVRNCGVEAATSDGMLVDAATASGDLRRWMSRDGHRRAHAQATRGTREYGKPGARRSGSARARGLAVRYRIVAWARSASGVRHVSCM